MKKSCLIGAFCTCMFSIIVSTNALAVTVAFNDLASFQASTNSLTLIDFDTDPNGDPTIAGEIGNIYSSLGITFSAGNRITTFSQSFSPPFGWLNNSLVGNDRVFDADFLVGGITAVGVHNIKFGSFAIIEAFDSSGVSLGTASSDNNGDTLDFFGLTTSDPISNIVITFTNPTGWGLDNLHFGAAAVPVSATVWLFGSGLLGLIGVARRKKAG